MKYQIVARNRNSWVGTPQRVDHYEEIYNCGHQHRSLNAASKCLRGLDGTTLSLSAAIEDQDGNIHDWSTDPELR